MNINSDINIIGGLPDFSLILHYMNEDIHVGKIKDGHQAYTSIKTSESVTRFKTSIRGSLLSYKNKSVKLLVETILKVEGIASNSLLLLFWNFSHNNDLLQYLNDKVFFPALYSGRLVLAKDEVRACLDELKSTEPTLGKWSESTLNKIAYKYLSVLAKFGILTEGQNKTIRDIYLDDKMLVMFIYWLVAVESRPNLIESKWLNYGFTEKPVLIERLLQKKLSRYISLTYTGDNLRIETLVPYETLYHELYES
jgi:hypothetical protein